MPAQFDIFLSHSSREKPTVERIAEKLKRSGLEPWLDKWCLTQGGDWQTELAAGLKASCSCAVFVGPHGIGNWEDLEYKLATDRMAKDRSFRVFLVLLPGLSEQFDASTLPPFLTIRTWVDLRKGFEDTRSFQPLINAIKGLPLGPERPLTPCNDICPYRGLQIFDEEHSEFFFGRDGDIQRLVEKLKTTRFLAVIGSSGSGKSSVVRAGLIPALHRGILPESETWKILVLKPGSQPLDALAMNLARLGAQKSMGKLVDEMRDDSREFHLNAARVLAERPSSERVVWVIDQFEEVFTLCPDKERGQFLASLLYAAGIPDGRNTVLLTMRADFYPKCAAYPEFSARIAAQQFLVSPMEHDGLRQAIEEPARRVGLEFEEGLVATILEDVAKEPGALPLLEHALLELWQRRRGVILSLEAYRESGGVEGAIAKRADAIYENFSAEQREMVRRIMLRLTQPGEGTEDTRRRARTNELFTRPEENDTVESVVRAMADARLLVVTADDKAGERVVDVSHEALIRKWPKLRLWIDEDRSALRVHRRLTDAAQEWEKLGRDESLLFRGARLLQAVEWRQKRQSELNPLEREFLEASVALKAREEQKEKERQLRLRRLTRLAAVIALFALLAAGFAWVQRGKAVRQTELAVQQTRLADSRRLAAESGRSSWNRDLAILLALASINVTYTNDQTVTTEALDSLRASAPPDAIELPLPGHTAPATDLAFMPTGSQLLTLGRDGRVRVWDLTTGNEVRTMTNAAAGNEVGLAVSTNGHFVAAGSELGVTLWELSSGNALFTERGDRGRTIRGFSLSPDGTRMLISFSSGEQALLQTMPERRQLWSQPSQGDRWVWALTSFSSDGRRVAGVVGDNAAVWDGVTGQTLLSITNLGSNLRRTALRAALSPDGSALVVASSSTIHVRSVPSGEVLADLTSQVESIWHTAFSPDGRWLAVAGDETLTVWDVPAQQVRIGYSNATERIEQVAFSPDSAFLAVGNDKSIQLWDLARRALVKPSGGRGRIAFSRGGQFASFGEGADVVVWETATASKKLTLFGKTNLQPGAVTFSADGRHITVASRPDHKVRVWSTDSGAITATVSSGRQVPITSVALSPDGKRLAINGGARNSEARIFDLSSKQQLATLKKHREEILSMAFSPTGTHLATGSGDATAIVWDLQNDQPVTEMTNGSGFDPIFAVAFSADGRQLATFGRSGGSMWDVNGGNKAYDLEDARSFESDIAISSNAIASRAAFWKMGLGRKLPLRGDGSPSMFGLCRVAFSLDGKLWANANANKFEIVDTSSLQQSLALSVPAGEVRAITFTPDGRSLLVFSSDWTLRAYPIALTDLMASARAQVSRELTPEERERYLLEPQRK
jgi:WD40 repeat protein